MKCPICKKSDEVVTRPDGPYCLDCGRAVLGPSDAATCSPSLSPETEAIWEQNRDSRDPAKIEGDLLAHAEKLEQERDEARRAAIRWQDAWTNETTLHEMGSTLMPWMRDWKKSEENASVLAQPGKISTNTENHV